MQNVQKEKQKAVSSFEPDLNQRPKDRHVSTTVLRSTNWAIEGSWRPLELMATRLLTSLEIACIYCSISLCWFEKIDDRVLHLFSLLKQIRLLQLM